MATSRLESEKRAESIILQTTTSPVPYVQHTEKLIRQGFPDSDLRQAVLNLARIGELDINPDRTMQATGKTPFQIEMPLGEKITVGSKK